MTDAERLNPVARRMFAIAIRDGRCGELLNALLEGGTATVSPVDELVIISAEQLSSCE